MACTLFLVRQWPTLLADVCMYVSTCTVCAQAKTGCPWSHIFSAILTIVDCFSKMVHFVPLVKLPSAKETTDRLIHHIFRIHGLPRDIVSDRGSQFTACFWVEFCQLLGIIVSLPSGFHPQSNGQTERFNQKLETGLRLLC